MSNVDKIGAMDLRAVSSVSFTVGTEAANTINVALQAKDADGNDVAQAVCLPWYLSSDSAGQAIGTAHSSAPAIGTDGHLITTLASLAGLLTFEADGDADIDFLDTGTGTVYLCVVLPDGSLAISDAITHA